DGQTLVSGGTDRAAFLWDISASLARRPTPPAGKRIPPAGKLEPVRSVAVAPDGRTLALGCGEGGQSRLWDLGTGREKGFLEHRDWLETVAFSPDGRTLATGCHDSGVRLYDLTQCELLTAGAGGDRKGVRYDSSHRAVATALGHTGRVWSVAFSPDGEKLASSGADGLVQVWDVERLSQRRLFLRQPGHVQSLAFSPDGRMLATNNSAGNAGLRDPHSGQLRLNLSRPKATRHPAASTPRYGDVSMRSSLGFSTNGRTLVIGKWEGHAVVWDLLAG